jgi:hypothetical protein
VGRDVEFDATVHDKSDAGLSSLERKFQRTQDRIRREQDKASKQTGASLLRAIGSVSPKLAAALADPILDAGKKGGPYLAAALAGGVTVASPFIGAAITGAILAGVGAGVAGIGVAVAAQDVRVRAAADKLWSRFEKRGLEAAGRFVQPTIAGIDRIGAALDTIDLDRLAAGGARNLPRLFDATANAAERFGDTLERLTDASGPSVAALARGIESSVDALSDGLDSLSDNGDSAAEALAVLFGIIKSSIDSVFLVVNGLTELWELSKNFGSNHAIAAFLKLTGQEAARADGSIGSMGDRMVGAGQVMRGAAGTSQEYATALAEAEKAARDLESAQRSLYGAQTSSAEAAANASKAIKENGRTLDLNTAKGRENRRALESLASALETEYDAVIKVNGVGAKSAEVAERSRAAFIRQARAAGLSASGAANLANKLGLIPTKRETRILADYRQAVAAAARVRAEIAKIPRHWRTTVSIAASVTGSPASRSALSAALGKQSLRFAAAGDVRPAGGPAVARTGGPVNVNSTVETRVFLDGEPFAALVATKIDESERRTRWRSGVGRR